MQQHVKQYVSFLYLNNVNFTKKNKGYEPRERFAFFTKRNSSTGSIILVQVLALSQSISINTHALHGFSRS